MNLDFLKRFIISSTVVLFGVVFSRELFISKSPEEIEEKDTISTIKEKINRKIASIEKRNELKNIAKLADPSLTTSRSQFRDVEVPENYSVEASPESNVSSGAQSSVSGVGKAVQNNRAPSKSPPARSGNKVTSATSSKTSRAVMGPLNSGLPGAKGGASDDLSVAYGSNSSNFSCNTSVGGGAFGNPISVSLTCTSSAILKYCLQEGGCCDPDTAGSPYSSPIIIGATDGSYCLSYVGISSAGRAANQQTYVINNILPHLQVSVPKIQYQTGQLPGVHHLQSNHFGESGYSIGEINLKFNDPGPLSLNLSCADIIINHATLAAPTPEEMFATLLATSVPSGSQLNVPFPLSKIVYGNNFITSFITNSNHPADVHSCSTNKIIVSDFEFFSLEATHGEAGNNAVREFSGGFIGYSFFESDTNLNRTPAGTSVEDEAGQELRTNSFSIYH